MNEENKIEFDSKPFTLLDAIRIYFLYKKKILIISAIVCLISVVLYFFVFDLIYTSTASIKSSKEGGSLLGGLDIDMSDLSDLDNLGIGGSKSAKELAVYEEILKSRKCLEPLIVKFGLMEREEYRFMEDAIKDFAKSKLKIETEKLSGVMYISVEDRDPAVAKEMVEFLINQLDKINIELNVQNAKNNRVFIEQRYSLAKVDLQNAEDSLKSFQSIYGIAPDLQIKAAAQSVFTLEGELKTEEVKLDVLRKVLSPDQLEVKTQEVKLNSLKEQIAKIQNSTDLNDFLRLGNSPQIAMQYLRLQRDLEIQTKILTFLLPIYEKAKIDEKRETPTIMILDKPVIAERKTKPKRLTMVIVLTGLAFAFSYSISVLIYKWKLFKNSESYKRIKLS